MIRFIMLFANYLLFLSDLALMDGESDQEWFFYYYIGQLIKLLTENKLWHLQKTRVKII